MGKRERELEEELRDHLARQAALHARAGLSEEEAMRRARMEFGALESVKEECREARALAFLETLAQDVRYGVRVLRRAPGFTAVAVASLALGIGANTAMFSLMDAALLKRLPVKEPERLVQVRVEFDKGKGWYTNVPAEVYQELSRAPRSFSDVFGFAASESTLITAEGAEQVTVHQVTGNFFAALGVGALFGRVLTREDDRPDATAAVLSYGFWARRFNRDPAVLGKTLYLGRTPVTVVGVTPPEFRSPSPERPADITLPPGKQLQKDWMWTWARLKPGVKMEQAQEEVTAAFSRYLEQIRPALMEATPRDRRRALEQRAALMPADKGTPGMQLRFAYTFEVLLAFTGVVLLIGCANIANLLLARAAARSSEIGLRLAIGAGRGRLVRQLLTESVLLAGIGAAAGLVFALWAHRVLLALVAGDKAPEALAFRLDVRVLGFTAGVSVLTGLLFGIAPALRATRVGVRGVRNRVGKGLVVAQVALAVVLLVGAGLFARTLRNLESVDTGFRAAESLLLVEVDAGQTPREAPAVLELYGEMARRVQALPGVKAAAVARTSVLGGGWWNTVWVQGYAHAPNENQNAGSNNVGPGFFTAAGVPVVAGREFRERDVRGAPEVVVVNTKLARRYFGNENPIGRRVGTRREPGKWEIVGVVADARYGNLRVEIPPMVYHALLQTEEKASDVVLHVRTFGDPALMAARVRQEVAAIDKQFPILKVTTLAGEVSQTLRRERMFATLSGFFGLLALGLTAVGLYGVIAYGVARRTSEIGLRLALGAGRRSVVWMVLRETLGLVVCGAAVGIPAAVGATRLIRVLLFGLKPGDPATVVAASLLLAAVGALAGYLPARRAARMDAMAALRYE